MVRPKGITLYLKALRDIINVVKSSLSGSILNLLKTAIISNLIRYLYPATRVRTLLIRGIGYLFLLVIALRPR